MRLLCLLIAATLGACAAHPPLVEPTANTVPTRDFVPFNNTNPSKPTKDELAEEHGICRANRPATECTVIVNVEVLAAPKKDEAGHYYCQVTGVVPERIHVFGQPQLHWEIRQASTTHKPIVFAPVSAATKQGGIHITGSTVDDFDTPTFAVGNARLSRSAVNKRNLRFHYNVITGYWERLPVIDVPVWRRCRLHDPIIINVP